MLRRLTLSFLAACALMAIVVPVLAQVMPPAGTVFNGGTITTPLKIPDGLATAPGIAFASNGGDTGLFLLSSERPAITQNGTMALFIDTGRLTVVEGIRADTGNGDVGFARSAANVWKVTDGGAGAGWVQQAAARSFLAADYTNATTTFSNTALSITVKTGRKYSFVAALFAADSTANEGGKLDFNGGTATATNFVATCILSNALGTPLTQVAATTAALATPLNIASYTDTAIHQYVCNGSLEPSGNGTFIIRGAQNSHTTGTLTVKRGSYIQIEDMP